jgi:sigma-B regulation protein RsbU (phosphoserine phosphatase)
VNYLNADGMALGVVSEIELEQKQTLVAPGDLLVLYTDGVTDALNSEVEEFGLRRLHRVVKANLDRSAADVIRAINRAVDDFVKDTPQFDDFTLVVLKRQR